MFALHDLTHLRDDGGDASGAGGGEAVLAEEERGRQSFFMLTLFSFCRTAIRASSSGSPKPSNKAWRKPVMRAQWYDGNISIPGCDNNMPGTITVMGRINRPSIMIYGGTIKPGHFQGNTYDIVSAFQMATPWMSLSLIVGSVRFVGVGAQRVRSLFQEAKIKGIILMAATNLPDILDPTLTSPGRFDSVPGGRLECTMQNIAANFLNTYPSRDYNGVESIIDRFILQSPLITVSIDARYNYTTLGR